jgi:predicted hydrocarbon binding protein
MNAWVKNLIGILDENLDEAARIKIMEACGEDCPFTHLNDEKLLEIKNSSENESDFLQKLSQKWRVKFENGNVYVVFDKCYCPLVNENIEGASKTLCYCTMGNLKKKFRIGLGRDVDVLMEKTVLAGDDECRFKVMV